MPKRLTITLIQTKSARRECVCLGTRKIIAVFSGFRKNVKVVVWSSMCSRGFLEQNWNILRKYFLDDFMPEYLAVFMILTLLVQGL